MMLSSRHYDDATAEDLSGLLVGKSITSIEGDTFVLSDGTRIELIGTGDCCAWFSASIENIDLSDNVVTRCESGDRDADGWSLTVFSAHKRIAEVNVDGDATSGYYCHSINMNVRKA